MAQLQGNIYNLQGSVPALQGGVPALQGGFNPQGFVGPVLPAPAPVTRYTAPAKLTRSTSRATPAAPAAAPVIPPPLTAERAAIEAGQTNSPWVVATPASTPAATPPPTPTATAGTPLAAFNDPIRQFYESQNRVTPTEADQQTIRENIRRQMQASIDAINAQYGSLISRQETQNQDMLGQTRAINARSGLMGSDFGQANETKTKEYNQQQIKMIEDERNLMLQSVFEKVDQRAKEEIQARKQEALGNQQAYLDYLSKSQAEAKKELSLLAGKGVKLETLNPAQRAKLFQQAGYDEGMGELIYNAQKPKKEQISYKYEKLADGQGLFYGTDPETGELKQQRVSIDIPPDFKLQITDDGTPLIFNPKTGEARIASGFGEGQFRKPFASEFGGGSGGYASSGDPNHLSPQAQAVINGTLKLEDLTPTVRGKIAGELTNAGYQRTANLSAAQREQIDGYDLLKREAESAKALLDAGIDTGPLASRTSQFKANFGFGNPDFIQYRSSIDNMSSYLLKLRSGAAVTPQEFERIKGYIPGVNDDQKTAKTKIQRFFEETTKAQENYVKRALQTEQSLKQEFSQSQSLDSLVSQFGGTINP
jgi:hypothetical protein